MQDYIPQEKDINDHLDTVTVKQFDNNSRFLHVKFKDVDLTDVDDNSFDLADCTTALYIKPESDDDDENVNFVNGTIESAESGIVTFLLPGGVTQNVGRYECEIWIYQGDETNRPVISTKPFTLVVEKSIKNDSAIEATPEYSALTATMTNYQALKNQMAALVASPAGSGGDTGTEVRDARVGKGQTYSTAGDAVRAAVQGVSAFLGATNFAASPVLADFNNLPNNIIRGCGVYVIPQSSSEADDIPAGKIKIANAPVTGQMTGLIVTLGRRTDRIAGDTQIFIPWHGGTILYRQYNSVSVEQSQTFAWSDWVTGNEDLPQHRGGINARASSYSNLLSNYTTDGTFIAAPDKWDDIPSSETYIIQNTRYSTYIVQTAISINSGAVYNRIVGKDQHNVWRDWTVVDGVDKRMKVLGLGDSICSGYRNKINASDAKGKGFIGDLGLPYKNIGIAGTTLSNSIDGTVDGKDRTCIPKQLLREATRTPSSENPAFSPDIIIANGGVNDYIAKTPIGVLPTAPIMREADISLLDESTVSGGLQLLLFYMIKYYPSAQRFFLITHKTKYRKPMGDGGTYSDHDEYINWSITKNSNTEQGYTFNELHDAIIQICNVYNVRVIDVYKDSFLSTVFSQYRSPVAYDINNPNDTKTQYVDIDGVHPLERGYLEGYKPLILAALKGNTSGTVSRAYLSQNEISEVLTG